MTTGGYYKDGVYMGFDSRDCKYYPFKHEEVYLKWIEEQEKEEQ